MTDFINSNGSRRPLCPIAVMQTCLFTVVNRLFKRLAIVSASSSSAFTELPQSHVLSFVVARFSWVGPALAVAQDKKKNFGPTGIVDFIAPCLLAL